MLKNNELNVRIQTKRDTDLNWTELNPILLNGEIIIVDTAEGDIHLKIGNGIDTYINLPFLDEYIISEQIGIHNMDENAHENIREAINQKTQVQFVFWEADD